MILIFKCKLKKYVLYCDKKTTTIDAKDYMVGVVS